MSDQAELPIAARFARAVRTVAAVPKDRVADTGSYKYRYTDLSDVLRVVKTALELHNLVLVQQVRTDSEKLLIVDTCVYDLDTGESLCFPGIGVPVKTDPQANGSTITYGRRYALTALFALEVEDDDGRAAHVAATQAGRRTEAEAEIRSVIATLTDPQKDVFKTEFLSVFKCGLTDLATSRHGDALTWVKEWLATLEATELDQTS